MALDQGLGVAVEGVRVIDINIDSGAFKRECVKKFDNTCREWSEQMEYNIVFLRAQNAYANDVLAVRGHLFLNEVYDSLGLPRTAIGAVCGWYRSDDGVDYVGFGEMEPSTDGSIRLEFNAEGVILGYI